ncbi:hypothetical protein NL676_031107 [Syzygium grande]|nr:hypothetical protein NL676_031107 [Syzygium grande]
MPRRKVDAFMGQTGRVPAILGTTVKQNMITESQTTRSNDDDSLKLRLPDSSDNYAYPIRHASVLLALDLCPSSSSVFLCSQQSGWITALTQKRLGFPRKAPTFELCAFPRTAFCTRPALPRSLGDSSRRAKSLRPSLVVPRNPDLSMVSFLFRNSASYADKPALVDADTDETLTFSQLESTVMKVAHGLLSLGLKKKDVVLIFSPNSVQFPLCFFGVAAIGAVATTANPLYTTTELSKQVKDSNPKLIVTVPGLWEKVKDLNLPAVILGGSRSVPPQISSKSRILSFHDLVSLGNGASSFPRVNVKQSDVAALLYSSGTTGTSKGVILTHGNFIAASLMVTMDQEMMGEMHHVFLCVLPMFHVFGLAVITYSQLQKGNALVSLGRFEFDAFLRVVEKYRITHLWVVPPIMLALAKQSVVRKYDLSSLKHIGSGAAPLGKDVMEDCAKNFPHAVVAQGYGMTETCGIVSVENANFGVRAYRFHRTTSFRS